MKLLVVFQPLTQFDMFTFVVPYTPYTICFTVLFSLTGGANKIFGFLVGNQKGDIFKVRGDEPPLNENMVQR